MKKIVLVIGLLLFLQNLGSYSQTLQVDLSPDKSKVDRSTLNGVATIFFDSSIEDLDIVCTDENPDEPIIKISDNLWFTHIDVKNDIETDGVCYRNYLIKCALSAEYYLTTDAITPNQVLYYTIALPNELEPRLQEEKAKYIAAKSEQLANKGDVFMAQFLALQSLPPNFPLTPDGEAALRRVWQSLILQGHDGVVRSAVFSPNGKHIVSAAWDRTVRIWDAQTGKELRQLRCPPMPNHATFSPDGTKILVALTDGEICIFDPQTGVKLQSFKGHLEGVESANFSPDGQRIVSASWDRTIRIWDVRTGKTLHIMEDHARVNSAVFSPDGKLIVSTSLDNARIWDAESGREVLKLSSTLTRDSKYAVFSKDGQRIAVASNEGALIFDSQTGKILQWLGQDENYIPASINFSPDGMRIVTTTEQGKGNTVRVWDAMTGNQIQCLDRLNNSIGSASFSPDGLQIALVPSLNLNTLDSPKGKIIHVWDLRKGESFISMKGPSGGGANSVCFSSDGEKIVSASWDGTVRLWDARTGNSLMTLEGHTERVNSVSFNPHDEKIVSASDDHTIRIWDIVAGKTLKILQGHTDDVLSAAYSPDGKKIVSASRDGTVRLWDVESGKALRFIDEDAGYHNSVVFSPDGKYIVSMKERSVHIWDSQTGALLKNIEGACNFLAMSPNGEKIASSSDNNAIRIWNARTGKLVRDLEDHTDYVSFAAFSPDNEKIVSGYYDGTIRIWDIKTGKTLQVIEGHKYNVTSVAFSPSGHRIVSSSSDKTIRVWDFPPIQQLIDEMRERFKDKPLAPEEMVKYYME